jgi:hypothetical protein
MWYLLFILHCIGTQQEAKPEASACLAHTDPIQAFIAEQAEILLEDYARQLNAIAQDGTNYQTKEAEIKICLRAFFGADSVLVYDDLYRYGTQREYFDASAYLHTIPSWYPSGAFFEFGPCTFHSYAYVDARHSYIAQVELERRLRGLDFERKMQDDSVRLRFYLEYAVAPSKALLEVRSPKIVLVLKSRSDSLPVPPIAWEPPSQDAEADAQPLAKDAVTEQIPAPLLALPATDATGRAKALAAAYKAHTPTSKGKLSRSGLSQAWRPWRQ